VILHPDRDRLRASLEAHGIQAGLHYPVPLHLQKPYRDLGYDPGAFPVSERIGRECLTLPLFPEMTPEQQDHVVDTLVATLRVGTHSNALCVSSASDVTENGETP
jgi:dTDP-4-amino-4,6-dideoxygalactose transaminase